MKNNLPSRLEMVACALSVCAVFAAAVFTHGRYVEAAGTCDSQYQQCISQKGSPTVCKIRWSACVKSKCPDVGPVGKCSQEIECQTYCTESGSSKSGNLGCCVGGPKMGPNQPNPCPDQIDGKCGKPELEKGSKAGEGEPKKGGEGEGGDKKGKEGMPEVPKPPGGGGGDKGGGQPPKEQPKEKSDIDSCKLGIGVGCEPNTAEASKAATPSAAQKITEAAAAPTPTPTPTTDTTPVASKQAWQPSGENRQYDLNPLTELRTTVSLQGAVGEPRAFGGDTFGGASYGAAQGGGTFGGAVSAVAGGFGSVLSGIQNTLTNLLGSLPRFFGR